MTKRMLTGLAVAVALLMTTVAQSGARAAPSGDHARQSRTAAGFATIRAAHFSPDTVAVDVYLTRFAGGVTALWLSDLGYGDVGAYRRLAAGLYVVSMRDHGAPASQPASLSWTLDARPGHAYTAAAVGMNAHLQGIVLADDLQQPRSGHARVRLIQAASRAPFADVTAGAHTLLGSKVAFAATTRYVSVGVGRQVVTAASADDDAVSTTARVRFDSGTVITLVLLDRKRAGIALRTVLDASAPAVAPKGSINAGGGGLAQWSALTSAPSLLAATRTGR